MSHEINITNEKASMMYVGEPPWHRLGMKLDDPATAAEAIKAAGLDFTVEKAALKTADLNLPVANHYATFRADTKQVLGVVGSRYVPIQNRDAFTLFDALVGEGEAIYHTAGALGKGERIWILAKLPDYIRVNGDDLVEKYLLLINTHDGSSVVRAKLTPIRVVCANTLAMALAGSEQEVRIRHTANAEAKLREAHEVIGLTNRLYGELDRIFNGMSRKKLNRIELGNFVETLFPRGTEEAERHYLKPLREKIFEIEEVGKGAEMSRGTLWGAYNAVTEYVDHCRGVKGNGSARLKSIWFGVGESIKKHAFKVSVQLLN